MVLTVSTLFGLNNATIPPPAINASSAMIIYIGIEALLVLAAFSVGAGDIAEGGLLKFDSTFSEPRGLSAAVWAPHSEHQRASASSGFPH